MPDSLTDSQATQLLTKYKSGALVTQNQAGTYGLWVENQLKSSQTKKKKLRPALMVFGAPSWPGGR